VKQHRLAAATVAALLAACTAPQGGRAKTDLELAIHFTELDSSQRRHGLSQDTVRNPDAKPITERVPWGWPVDLDSRIDIALRKDALASASLRGVEALDTEALAAGIETRRALLAELAPVLETRALALEAYSRLEAHGVAGPAPLEADFDIARDAAAKAVLGVKRVVGRLWPQESTDEAVLAMRDLTAEALDSAPAMDKLCDELNRQIRAAERELEQVQAELRKRQIQLRIECFLTSNGDDPVPTALHLPGYDTIESRAVERRDRFGIMLSDEERGELRRLWAATRDFAQILNRVRDGSADFEQALAAANSDLARRLGEEAQAFEAFAKLAEDLPARLASSRTALQEFRNQLAQRFDANARPALEQACDSVAAQLTTLERLTELWNRISELASEIPQLRERWKNLTPETLLTALDESESFFARVSAVATDARPVLAKSAEELKAAVKAIEGELAVVVGAARAEVRRAWGATLAPQIEDWMDFAQQGRERLQFFARLLDSRALLNPVAPQLRAPGSFDIEIDDAPDTYVDLAASPAKIGDSVEVRTTLLESGEPTSTSSAIFRVQRLGWHAQFAPSVVLVSADKLAGQSDDAGFSPALAWMLRYTPRPDQTGFWNDFSRWTRWGIGPHAALLNFDPQNDTEIGLGLTLGLWGEILQFGAGYNLMADASDEAQIYYYVGSSLIPMLQALDAD